MSKKEAQQREIDELKQQLEQKTNEHTRLSTTINDLKSVNDQLQVYIYIKSNSECFSYLCNIFLRLL